MNISTSEKTTNFGFLDGVRGFAALWVVVSHILLYNGWSVPILSAGNIAVDVFIMVSGFLMTYHYMERREKEPWEKPKTWLRFWLRRFFRIAPVYYLVLITKMLVASHYAGWHETVGNIFSEVSTDYSRYSDHSAANVLMHGSFLFGLDPYYSNRSPGLPDWSISLEMQFYFLLPFLALLSQWRGGMYALSILLVGLSWAAWTPWSEFLSAFFLPSFIGLKIHMFLIGMILASGIVHKKVSIWLQLPWVLLLATAPLETGILDRAALIRYAMVLMLFALVNAQHLPTFLGIRSLVAFGGKLLSSRFCTFMADMSYSVYLVHNFFILPVTVYLLAHYGHEAGTGALRSAICFAVVVPLTYLCAWGLRHAVEVHGINMGRIIAKKIK